MLFAHKLIDTILGQSKKIPMRTQRGFDSRKAEELVPMISEAVKFDFGRIHAEQIGSVEHNGNTFPEFRLPELTNDERDWWVEGFFPTPFPLVWYEFGVADGIRNGALIEDIDGAWYVKFVDFNTRDGHFAYNGSTLRLYRSATSFHGRRENAELFFEVSPRQTDISPKSKELQTNLWSAKLSTLIYLTVALGSKTADRKTEVGSDKLNRNLERRGRCRQFEHTVVDISPSKFMGRAEGDGAHTSPRVHKRRSHKRHLGHQVPGAKLVTSGENAGKWAIVIPWCWVNKASASEPMIQEYRVRLG
jgi:hypothetical protein